MRRTVLAAAILVLLPLAARAQEPPVADAGVDRDVDLGETVTLDGTGSSDPDGDDLTYSWRISSEPSGGSASLSGDTTDSPSFEPDAAGLWRVELTVDDGTFTDSDEVDVNVTDPNDPGGGDPGSGNGNGGAGNGDPNGGAFGGGGGCDVAAAAGRMPLLFPGLVALSLAARRALRKR